LNTASIGVPISANPNDPFRQKKRHLHALVEALRVGHVELLVSPTSVDKKGYRKD
jgi:hypothetical protein